MTEAHRDEPPSMSYEQRQVKRIMTLINRWKGRAGELFGLSTSIKTLTVLFRGDQPHMNLVISCVDPLRIEANSHWMEIDMKVEVLEPCQQEARYLLVDKDAGLRIECGLIEAAENRKLW